jgi:L-ornithine N5-monooxygenase
MTDFKQVDVPIVDVLGVGFGPANLALAIAVEEYNQTNRGKVITSEFLEKKLAFGWHRGMLIEGATMQVSFLKDLATMRNPASRFSFLSYLYAKGRLVDFINHKCLFPSRIEFHDYLEWSAGQVEHQVHYGHEVVSARPVSLDGMVTHYEVFVRMANGGAMVVKRARNLVVAPGLSPHFPPGLRPSARVWHSHTLLDDLAELEGTTPRRFAVLGAGQSAAEVTEYLHRSYPTVEVCALFSRFGYSQSDDSPFANRIFDPETVDVFYGAPEDVKATLRAYHANTNYSVVDVDLIEELYRRFYQEKICGVERLRLFNVSELAGVRERAGGVKVTVRGLNSGTLTTLDADVLVCATGYRPTDPLSLLGEVAPLLWRDRDGLLLVERDYRVATAPDVLAGVYLQGGTEHSHGITSSLLSNAAIRAAEILDSMVARGELAVASEHPYTQSVHHA